VRKSNLIGKFDARMAEKLTEKKSVAEMAGNTCGKGVQGGNRQK